MTTFVETRLEDCVAYGFQSVPTFSTRIVELDNGKEVRNANWTRPKHRYSALYQNFSLPNFALLLACFMAVRGSAYPFRFKDHTDYTGTMEPLGNTPGANQTPVQLIKTYTMGAVSLVRTIDKPVSGTVTVYQDNGSGVFVAKAGSIDTTTGLFTPTTNWTAGRALKATYEFDTPVRFVSDEFPSSYDNLGAVTVTCELEEVFL